MLPSQRNKEKLFYHSFWNTLYSGKYEYMQNSKTILQFEKTYYLHNNNYKGKGVNKLGTYIISVVFNEWINLHSTIKSLHKCNISDKI